MDINEGISEGVNEGVNEVSEGVTEPDFELDFCEKCFQMTNHLRAVCQKCKRIIPYVPPEDRIRII